MANSTWYYVLIVLFTLLLIYTVIQKKDPKLGGVYLFIAGLTYLFEFIVLVIFNSYAYYPRVLENNYFDNIFGAVVSDAFSVPMTATFIAAYQLSFMRTLWIALIFILLEALFVRLGIYEHFWWEYLYTYLGLIVNFALAKKWFRLLGNSSRVIKFVTIYFASLTISSSISFIVSAYFHLVRYHIGLFSNPTREHVFLATIFILFSSLIFSILVVFRLKLLYVVIIFLGLTAIDYILADKGILQIFHKWSLWLLLLNRFLIYAMLMFVHHYFLKARVR